MSEPVPLPSHDLPGAPWGGRRTRILLAILLAGMLLGWFARQPALSTGGDEATYLLLSESLAQGHYRDEFVLGTPLHAKYPPGMPAWLLVVHSIGGSNLDIPRGINLLLLSLTALLAADMVRRLVAPTVGLGVAAAVSFNPAMVQFAGSLLSETLYGILSLLAIWALYRHEGRHPVRHAGVIAVVGALAAFLTRTAGISLVAAVVVTLLLQRRRWTTLAGAMLLAGGAFAWIRYVGTASEGSLGRNYTGEVAYSVSIASGQGFLAHVVDIAKSYLIWVPSSQFGFPAIPDAAWDNAVWAAIIAIPAVVGVVLLVRRWLAGALYLGAYIAMLLLWPFADARLAVPMLPTLLVGIAVGVDWGSTRLGLRHPQRVALAAIGALAAVGAVRVTRDAIRNTGCRAQAPYQDPACHSGPQRDWIAASNFVADSLPETAVVATTQPAPLYLRTHRRTLPWERLYEGTADTLLTPRGPVSHVLVSELGQVDLDVRTPWPLARRCADARVIARFGDATMLVSLLPADSTRGLPACDLLPPGSSEAD